MMRNLLMGTGWIMGGCLAASVLGQTSSTRPAVGWAAAGRVPEYAGSSQVPARLLDDQADQVIILPSEPGEVGESPANLSGGALARPAREIRPLPEGFIVAQRSCHIRRQGNDYVVELDHRDNLPDAMPMRILPNTRLDVLESYLSEGSQSNRYLVTGRVTEFQGSNYILLVNVSEQLEELPTEAEMRVSVAPPSEPPTSSAVAPATQPSGREPTSDELMKQLMQDRPIRSVVPAEPKTAPPTAPARELTDVADRGKDQERVRWPEATFLSDRLVRLMPAEGGWVMAFEDPGRNPRDVPIRVLPSRLLENAISLTAGGTRSVVLVVSGEVTAYKNANYLLLRKVLVRRDNGNLR